MTATIEAASRRAIPLLDLTSLNDADDDAAILTLCRRAVTPVGRVAAVCVFPRFVQLARTALDPSGIKIATVVNFPEGADDLSQTIEQTEYALENGADEIDLVYPWRASMMGYRQFCCDMVDRVKTVCGARVPLKVIMESGAWPEADPLYRAARDAIQAGADMLKTSTGKIAQGATLDAALLFLQAIQAESRPVGLKISGGVRTAEQAAAYLELADRIMGSDWVSPKTFRFGASSLLDDLLAHLGHASKPAPSGNLY